MGNDGSSVRRNWAIIGTFTVIICIIIGLYFYNNYFRQSNAQLIETVPTDAVFIFQIHDNRAFVSDATPLLPYLNEVFNMTSFSGFEFFLDQLQSSKHEFIISGHQNGDNTSLLYSFRVPENIFDKLFIKLKIDPRNFTAFNDAKIYNFGTHYKRFQFTYHNGVFSISEDLELLKKSIVQLKSMKNLLGNRSFQKIYGLVNKNQKQNWIILNNSTFFSSLHKIFKPEFHGFLSNVSSNPSWSAYQIRFNDNEISMMGYSTVDKAYETLMEEQKNSITHFSPILPFYTNFYTTFNTPNPAHFFSKFQGNKTYSISLANYQILQPLSTTYFSLNQDSISYYYMAFKCDTAITPISTLLIQDSTNQKIMYKNIPIYISSLTDVYPHLNKRYKSEKLSYFITYQNYYIFSSSPEALQYYLKVTPNNNIESSPYYRFAKSNLPSENSFEFFLSATSAKKWEKYLHKDYFKLNIAKNLKLISYSYSLPQDELIGVNVFIKF
jgi:hypothetical protein